MNKLLTILYILSSVADYGLTVWGIMLTSFEVEVNWIAQEILVHGGTSGLFAFKFGGMAFVIAVIARLAYITRGTPRMKYLVPAVLLYGITVSLIGAWSWVPHILENM